MFQVTKMREEGHTYSQRSFTMKNGLVVPLTLDDWYWQQLDKFVVAQPGCDAVQITCDLCFDAADAYAKEKGIDFNDAFEHVLAFTIYENMRDL